jgi:hypothetical protein
MEPLKYCLKKNLLTIPHSFYPLHIAKSIVGTDKIAETIGRTLGCSKELVEETLEGFKNVCLDALGNGSWITIENFFWLHTVVPGRMTSATNSVVRSFKVKSKVSESFKQEVSTLITFEKPKDTPPPAAGSPAIIDTQDVETMIHNFMQEGKGFIINGNLLKLAPGNDDVWITSPAGNRIEQNNISLNDQKQLIIVPSVDPTLGPAGKNSVELQGLGVKNIVYPGRIRLLNEIDSANNNVFLVGAQAGGVVKITAQTAPTGYTVQIVVRAIGGSVLFSIMDNGISYPTGSASSAGTYVLAWGSYSMTISIVDFQLLVSNIRKYSNYLREVVRLFLGLVFHTVNDGSSAFVSIISKTGDPVDWDLGDGTIITGSNSVSYSGYTDSSTKTVTIFNIDSMSSILTITIDTTELVGPIPGLSKMTALETFYCNTNGLTGSIPDLSNNTALRYFRCNTNQLTGSIPDLSNNTALQNFYCDTNELTGSIPSLSNNIVLQRFYCNANQITGSIPNLSSNVILEKLYCNTNQLVEYAGGIEACVKLRNFDASNNLLTEQAVSDIIDGLWIIRVQIGALSCSINIGGTGNAAPDADAVAKIEGTGAYAGDGLKDAGCTVAYN